MKILGLDVGEKRIGVARADSSTRIAVPVGTIVVDGTEWHALSRLARQQNTQFFVVGLPRNNSGVETRQSLYARNFAHELMEKIPGARVRLQDETLTSVLAEKRLKDRGRPYTNGEIDAEAAAIILQDFLESLSTKSAISDAPSSFKNTPALAKGDALASAITEVTDQAAAASQTATDDGMDHLEPADDTITNPDGTVSGITKAPTGAFADADTIARAKAVKEAEKAKMRAKKKKKIKKLGGTIMGVLVAVLLAGGITVGVVYVKNREERQRALEEAAMNAVAETYDFTIRPGETVADVKKSLLALTSKAEDKRSESLYTISQVEDAFNKDYSGDYPFLAERPEGATNLEGFLYPETIQFYETDAVEKVIKAYLAQMDKTIKDNNLEAAYAAQGFTIYQGVTLASIIQKESWSPDMPVVSQIFQKRLNIGMSLGSDVTVRYALDKVDPERTTYTDNAAALTIDSCYNTRIHTGLPCGPIANPGLNALLSVASPADTDYLYFLTDSSGKMYYGSTEAEHIQNIYTYCGDACATQL